MYAPGRPLVQLCCGAVIPASDLSQQHLVCCRHCGVVCGCHEVQVYARHRWRCRVQHDAAHSAALSLGKWTMSVDPTMFIPSSVDALHPPPGGGDGGDGDAKLATDHVSLSATERSICADVPFRPRRKSPPVGGRAVPPLYPDRRGCQPGYSLDKQAPRLAPRFQGTNNRKISVSTT